LPRALGHIRAAEYHQIEMVCNATLNELFNRILLDYLMGNQKAMMFSHVFVLGFKLLLLIINMLP